jgi:hypothetical protein
MRAGISRHRLEPLEAPRKPVPIRAVLDAARQVDSPAVQPLQGFEHRAIVSPEQSVRHMKAIVAVNGCSKSM